MKTRATSMPLKIVAFCAFGAFVAAEEISSSSLHSQRGSMNGLSYEEPSDKRAYTYVSEYKRLPVYNFGIGKRWVDNGDDKRSRTYSFGLGKRGRNYDFGLGKRTEYAEYRPVGLTSLDYLLPVENYEGYHLREDNTDDMYENKRGGYMYRFGLGKRAWNAVADSIGTGKRPNEDVLHRYNFGIGKRDAEDDELNQ